MAENKIKLALYLNGWDYENGNTQTLKTHAQRITVKEFDISMKSNIFCPICFTPITRRPLDKDNSTNGRKACFSHIPTYSHIECPLRVPKAEGKLYNTEEEAKQAIDDKELVIISKFRSEPPEQNDSQAEEYDQTPVEDSNGPLAEVPISRHTGEIFKLPSTSTSIRGLCRNFYENYNRYYLFPEYTSAILLSDLLVDIKKLSKKDIVKKIENPDQLPMLYYGKILSSYYISENNPNYIKFTQLECAKSADFDFCIKAKGEYQERHGIKDNTESKGRIVLCWGTVEKNGDLGYAIRPVWGEFALLPIQYEKVLY
ncbi:hypothetical protein A1Z17_RS00625 [Acinetobacter baumannii]|nr:hypothetical protein [Acinetobacter baumannii]EHU1702090.1 hypothetical protein [Acinetobacter baumannii]